MNRTKDIESLDVVSFSIWELSALIAVVSVAKWLEESSNDKKWMSS